MARSESPQFARLLDWIEGRLSEEEAQVVAAQVAAADNATRQTVAWLRAFRQISAQLVFEAPPQATHDLLTRRFAAFARARQRPSVLQRVVAALTFDSSARPALADVRGVDSSAARRQLIYSSDTADLALNIAQRSADQRFDLSGQVFVKSDQLSEPLIVHLLLQDNELETTSTDDLGEFAFVSLAHGDYTLLLRGGSIEMVVAPVDLRLEP
jgi:hypothetical protein